MIAPRAVVTGASSGIGRATALELAAAGLEVIAVARRERELVALAAAAAAASEASASTGTAETAGARREEGGAARASRARGTACVRPVVADVTSPEGRARVRSAVGSEPLGALVHGAGVFPRGLLDGTSPESWRAAMATNVDARLHLVQDLAPALRGGRVLFVGSDAATNPRAGGAAYSVSKAASLMLWRCLQLELGDRIGFAMAKPGLVATGMLEESLAAPRESFPAGAVYEAMCARGETVAAETVARFFRWLLLEVDEAELVADVWDIRDPGHRARWLEGPLYGPGTR